MNKVVVLGDDPGLQRSRASASVPAGTPHYLAAGKRSARQVLGVLGLLLDGRSPQLRVFVDEAWLMALPAYQRRILQRAILTINDSGAPVPCAGSGLPGKVLLVGDRPSCSGPLADLLPFAGLTRAGCSARLAEHLEDAGVPEDALTWVNAYKSSGRPRPRYVLDGLYPAGVITLGEEARAWYKDARGRQPTVALAHPMYWQRFKNRLPYPLGAAIKGIQHVWEHGAVPGWLRLAGLVVGELAPPKRA